jgi:hypothetical protein
MNSYDNLVKHELYNSLFFDENTPKFSFHTTNMIWKHLLDSLYNKEISNNEDTDKEFDIMFDIDPPQPVPLKRQKVCTSESDIKQAMMELLDLDKLDQNQIMFTKCIDVQIHSKHIEIGTMYIKYIMRTDNNDEIIYYTGVLLIPPEWDYDFNKLTIFKRKIDFY